MNKQLLKYIAIGAIILLLCSFFILYYILTVDYSFSTITSGHDISNFLNISEDEILEGEAVTASFKGEENYLGVVLISFNNFDRMNTDILRFSIKEKEAKDWYYQTDFKAESLLSSPLFPFGFPPIVDSKGKIYEIQIHSLHGEKGNAVGINTTQNEIFYTKYQYPEGLILQDKESVINFLKLKLQSLFKYYDLLLHILFYILPFVYYVFSFFYFKKTFLLIKKLLKKYHIEKILNKTQVGKEIIKFYNYPHKRIEKRIVTIGVLIIFIEAFLNPILNIFINIFFVIFLIIACSRNKIINYLVVAIFFSLPIIYQLNKIAAEKFATLTFLYALYFITKQAVLHVKSRNTSFY